MAAAGEQALFAALVEDGLCIAAVCHHYAYDDLAHERCPPRQCGVLRPVEIAPRSGIKAGR